MTLARTLTALLVVALAGPAPALAQNRERKPEPWFLTVSHRVDLENQAARMTTAPGARASVHGGRYVVNVTSGVLVDAEGHVITRLVNLDPTAAAPTISVTTTSGRILPAALVGLDAPTGLAVLHVAGLRGAKPLPLAAPPGFADGEAVTILSPEYKIRQLPAPIERIAMPPSLVEHRGTVAVAVPHPALGLAGVVCVVESRALTQSQDLSLLEVAGGRVVGLVKVVAAGQGQVVGVPFLHDAVARRVVAARGNVAAGMLGATGNSSGEGVRVEIIDPNGPAASAGLERDDVIVGFSNFEIHNTFELANAVGATPAGTTVELKVKRGGRELTISPVLAARPLVAGRPALTQGDERWQAQLMQLHLAQLQRRLDSAESPEQRARVQAEIDRFVGRAPAPARPAAPRPEVNVGSLGIGALDVNPQLAKTYKVKGGVFVTQVAKESLAERSGLVAGDVITGVDGAGVSDEAALREALRRAADGGAAAVALTVVRGGAPVELTLSVESLR